MTKQIKHAIIVCHPVSDSFTMAVAERYAQTVRGRGHKVVIRDLYRIGFDPVLSAGELGSRYPSARLPGDVVDELEALAGTDVFVLVYPVWFGAPPAMIKGYIERVFGARFAFRPTGARRHRLFAGKRLVSLTTSGSMLAWLDEQGALTSLRNLFENYLAKVFGFAATDHLHLDGVVPGLPARDYRMFLKEVEVRTVQLLADISAARETPGRAGTEASEPFVLPGPAQEEAIHDDAIA